MRLHGEVELLIESRALYDRTRPTSSANLGEAVDILASGSDDIKLTQAHCDAIADSSFTTIPPADLPTIRELLSSGHKVYTDRAVLPVSRELAKLHETLDQALV